MGLFNKKDKNDSNDGNEGYSRPPVDLPNDPPPYNEFEGDSQPPSTSVPDYNSLNHPQTAQGYPDEKKQFNKTDNQYQNNQYQSNLSNQYQSNQYQSNQYQSNQYPSGQPPYQGTYVVPSNHPTINIAHARPDQVNPAYQDYLRRDEQRIAQGNLPNNHKAPLAERKTDKTKKTGGGAFPGRQGASYYNAANK